MNQDANIEKDLEVLETKADFVKEPEVVAEKEIRCIVDEEKVEKTIRSSVYISMGVGIIPLPLVDFAALTANNLNLVRQLSGLYGVEFKESVAKKIIVALTCAGAPVLASSFVKTVMAGIPLIGLPLAVGTRPVLNGMCTYAVGQMFVAHFKRGGSFIGANTDAMKEDFNAAFQNSREWLGNTISGKKATEPEAG